MKMLLHTCCAPCSIKCIDDLRDNGDFEITAFWYNPNIHPWTEYKVRRDTLIEHCNNQDIAVLVEDKYGLREFICDIYPNFDLKRCEFCYMRRMEKTAERASKEGYDGFSTTLLISPYQKHDMLYEIGLEMGKKYAVRFIYRDFRPYFREGQRMARSMGLYMQKYCGCIFSEEERYTFPKKDNGK